MNGLGGSVLVGAIGAPVLMALLGIYLSSRNIRWYAKYLLVAAVTAPLLYIRTPELMLILIIEGWSVLLLTEQLKRLHRDQAEPTEQRRQTAKRFQLGDALWAISLIAVILAVVAQFDSRANGGNLLPVNTRVFEMVWLVCWGLVLGASTIAIGFLWHARKIPRYLILFAVALGCSVSGVVLQKESLVGLLKLVATVFTNPDLFVISRILQLDATDAFISLAAYLVSISGVTALLMWAFGLNFVWITKNSTPRESEKQRSQRSIWVLSRLCVRLLFIASGFLMAGLLASCFVMFLPPKKYIPTQPYDSARPNGLLKLVEASRELNPVLDNWPPVVLGKKAQAKIDANQACFDHLEEALACGNFAWMDWENLHNLVAAPGSSFFLDYSDVSNEVRKTARAFSFRALQSLHESRFDDVISDATRGFQVADVVNRDPHQIGSLVSTAIEGISHWTAVSGVSEASKDSLTHLKHQLDKMMLRNPDAAEETAQVISAERWLVWKKGSLEDRFTSVLTLDDENTSVLFRMLRRRNVHRRLLQTEIAIELFRRQHKRPPRNLNELVPDFLAKVPADPFRPSATPGPLTYRLSEDGRDYVLYSFGLNSIDDNGETPDDSNPNVGDINLTTVDRLAEHAVELKEYKAKQKSQAGEVLDDGEGFGDDFGDDFGDKD